MASSSPNLLFKEETPADQPREADDGLWNSSATARHIQTLGQVETDIATLLQLASSAVQLLGLPPVETDEKQEARRPNEAATEETIPAGGLTHKEKISVGEERSELFVEKANQYFDTLDSIQYQLRRELYDLRLKRISPSSIDAPPANFIPRPLGVGAPPASSEGADGIATVRQGLQETRVEKEAWLGMVQALEILKAQRQRNDLDPALENEVQNMSLDSQNDYNS